MDVQTEKLHLIEQLIKLQDTSIIQKVKDILQDSDEGKIVGYNPDGSMISKSDLITRAESSNQAIKEGKTKSIDEIRANMKSW